MSRERRRRPFSASVNQDAQNGFSNEAAKCGDWGVPLRYVAGELHDWN